jgi:zinc protease
VVELVLSEFKQLGSARVAADELAARKATLIGSYGNSLETTAGLAEQVGELAIYGVKLEQIGKYIEQVQAVTPKQIEKYAAKYLDAGGSKVVVVGDAAQFGAAIRQAHPDAVLLESSALDLDGPSLQPTVAAPKTGAR